MPGFTDGALSGGGSPERAGRSGQPSVIGESPPALVQILGSLAILIVISLGFALAARLLVG